MRVTIKNGDKWIGRIIRFDKDESVSFFRVTSQWGNLLDLEAVGRDTVPGTMSQVELGPNDELPPGMQVVLAPFFTWILDSFVKSGPKIGRPRKKRSEEGVEFDDE